MGGFWKAFGSVEMPPKTKKSKNAPKAKVKGGIAKKAAKAPPPQPENTSIWEKKPRDFGIGNAIRPKMDVTRFTKWPRYVVLQRKRRVLQQRLKVPPALNQFTKTLDQNTAANVFKLLNKYRPEDKSEKKARLLKIAKGKAGAAKKPLVAKCGINHVTKLIEEKRATLVLIAHDVDPLEIVLHLPALCRKQDIPFAFVKGKARLGQVVHKKTATCIALTGVRQEDRQLFSQIVQVARSGYNDKFDDLKRQWGGGVMGKKTQAIVRRKQAAVAKASSEKAKYS